MKRFKSNAKIEQFDETEEYYYSIEEMGYSIGPKLKNISKLKTPSPASHIQSPQLLGPIVQKLNPHNKMREVRNLGQQFANMVVKPLQSSKNVNKSRITLDKS